MKKYLLLVFLYGCGYAPMTSENPLIVDEIETAFVRNSCNCMCNYYGRNNAGKGRVITPTSTHFKYTDTCGKYQIGDTLKITK